MVFEWQDFLEEIKMEMYGYDEIEEEYIFDWQKRATKWVKQIKNRKNIIKKNTSISIEIEDESDIFKIVDSYYYAIVHEDLEQYWASFSL